MAEQISEEVLQDSLKVLERAIRSINTNKLIDLELISNELIHNATIEQDKISSVISKIIYGIFKLERHSAIKNLPLPTEKIVQGLIKMHDLLGLGKVKDFLTESGNVSKIIEKIGVEIKLYNVLDRAGVKKGGKMYDHGVSLAQAAKTMNVSQWELYPYVGKTKLNDYPEDVDKRVVRRIEYTRRLFQ